MSTLKSLKDKLAKDKEVERANQFPRRENEPEVKVAVTREAGEKEGDSGIVSRLVPKRKRKSSSKRTKQNV